jgi:hypothetical protein
MSQDHTIIKNAVQYSAQRFNKKKIDRAWQTCIQHDDFFEIVTLRNGIIYAIFAVSFV